jgi:hypothetical protein
MRLKKQKSNLKILNKMKRKKFKSLSQPEETGKYLQLRDVKLDNLIDVLLSEDVDKKARMLFFRVVLLRLLTEYVSISEIREKSRSQDIIFSFRCQLFESRVEVNEDIDQNVSEVLRLIKDDSRESFFRPVVSRLVCMYAVFAVSDRVGSKKCNILAKDLLKSKNNTPERLVLSVLKQRALRRGEKIPPNECELLYRYTF